MSRGFQALSLTFAAAFIFAASLHAQSIDSSTAVLLRPTGKGPSSRQNLDTSRYRIRAPESRVEDDSEDRPGALIPTPVPNKPVSAKASSSTTLSVSSEPPAANTSVPAPVVPKPETPPEAKAAPSATTPQNTESSPSAVVDQVKSLLLGGRPEDIEEYRQQIHPEDPRSNILRVSLAPGYFYSGSSSDYSFRRYSTHGPGLGLGMNVWLTPFVGLQSRYFTSFSSSVSGGNANEVSFEAQEFEAGVRFRKHFGFSRKANYMLWGFDYHDSQRKIASEATSLVGHKTSGIKVSLEAHIPTSLTYSYTLGVDFHPQQKHVESKTSAEAKSGSKSETNAVGIAIGGEWTLDRKNQIFWRGQYSVERNLFKGTATKEDPGSETTPQGVSVTDSFLMFQFGFSWGS